MRSLLLLMSLPILALLGSGCTTFRVNDYPLTIRLPASRECYERKVMSKQSRRYSEEECDKIVARGIILTSETWRLMRADLKANCQNAKCRQLEGAADDLFIALDKALQVIP